MEPVAGVSKRFKTIAISYSAQGSSFADRNKFPYFFRTIGETGQFKCVLFKKIDVDLANCYIISTPIDWVAKSMITRNHANYSQRKLNKFFFSFIWLLSCRYVFLTLLQQLGWKRVGALMSDGKKYSDYVNTIQDYAESNKITFITTRKITSTSSLEVIDQIPVKSKDFI